MNKKVSPESVIILHNVRSEHNVGSAFRTGDAAGISKIYLSGYTPTPTDRFGREVKTISKVALDAQNYIPWEKVKNISALITQLKKENYKIIAIEQDRRAIDYKKIKTATKTAFIFGNEVKGISKSVLDLADEIAFIPMKGKKESLNVSVSLGIALFRILKI